MRQRLHKYLASCGLGSRRHCEELIAQGRVEVDGQLVTTPGSQVDPETSQVRCDGAKVRPPRLLYFLLNKPRGTICNDRGRPGSRAIDFAPREAAGQRLFTIGRLDVESEGALLLTNDGELCHLVTHPRFQVEKTYQIELEGNPDEAALEQMRRGVWLSEGRTGELAIRILAQRPGHTVLEVRLRESVQREIQRVCARFGFPVRRLRRVAIGPIRLDRLPRGRTRALSEQELSALRDSATVVIRLGGRRAARPTRRPARRGDAARGERSRRPR